MSSILCKGEVFKSISLLLPTFSNQVVEWCTLLEISVTWFIVKFTICQSLRFSCFASFDLLLIMSMIDYCLFCSHIDLEIKLILFEIIRNIRLIDFQLFISFTAAKISMQKNIYFYKTVSRFVELTQQCG